MGQFVVIGLGRFGSTVARVLFEKGQDVVAVDSERQPVEDARAYSQQAIQADVRGHLGALMEGPPPGGQEQS